MASPWAVSPLSPGSTSTTVSLTVIGRSTSITCKNIKRQIANQDLQIPIPIHYASTLETTITRTLLGSINAWSNH